MSPAQAEAAKAARTDVQVLGELREIRKVLEQILAAVSQRP